MLIRDFPGELIITIGAHLKARDLYHLILVGHRFSALLLSRLRSLACQPKYAQTALYWAVLSSDRKLARYVLEKAGFNIQVTGKTDEDRSIMICIDSGIIRPAPRDIDEETLDLVMRQGASLEVQRRNHPFFVPGHVAAAWAIQTGHHTLLKLALLKRNNWSGQACFEMLLYAFCRGKHGAACRGEKAIKIILQWASHSLAQEDYREAINSILLEAVGRDEETTVQFLLNQGADPNAGCDETPALVEAAKYANPRVVGLLLEHGADISVLDGKEPLLVDFGIGCHSLRIVEMLEQSEGKLYLGEDHDDSSQKAVEKKMFGTERIKYLARISKTMA